MKSTVAILTLVVSAACASERPAVEAVGRGDKPLVSAAGPSISALTLSGIHGLPREEVLLATPGAEDALMALAVSAEETSFVRARALTALRHFRTAPVAALLSDRLVRHRELSLPELLATLEAIATGAAWTPANAHALALSGLLGDESTAVRLRAAQACARVPRHMPIPALEQAHTAELDATVKQTLATARLR
jgi:hypothetical protein